jgi:hypothetical protein
MSAERNEDHFQGKGAIEHVIEAHAQGIIASAEIHGTEIPGHLSAAADSARETAIMLFLLVILLDFLDISTEQTLWLLAIFSCGWLVWKTGRSALLAWSRLERLHRVVAEEKWEIEHHRAQEREELRVLYAAKGFEGKLLEEVLDVLMADGDRLLRVMLEEELGLSLEVHEHPLKQSLGALIGTLVAGFIVLLSFYIYPDYGAAIGAAIVMAIAGASAALCEKNRPIPAVVWNVGVALLTAATVYFLLQFSLVRG